MAKVLNHSDGTISFHCPGCGERHAINFDGKHHWVWNEDVDKPTISPSILRRSGHYIPNSKGECWCSYSTTHPDEEIPFKCEVCHLFVINGQIQFLFDCTHNLAGQIVNMLDED